LTQRAAEAQSAPEVEAPRKPAFGAFIVIIAATALVAGLGALASAGEADPWYAALNKAPGTPPGYVFGIVWPALYALVAIGACLAWRASGGWKRASPAAWLYVIQLLANLGWSYLFFRYHLAAAALFDIAALWLAALLMIREFHRHSRLAAWLQYPYLAWLSFAAYLNAWVVAAN
jgi:tryptophan-rich sensory protein